MMREHTWLVLFPSPLFSLHSPFPPPGKRGAAEAPPPFEEAGSFICHIYTCMLGRRLYMYAWSSMQCRCYRCYHMDTLNPAGSAVFPGREVHDSPSRTPDGSWYAESTPS